jgi:hypothetical protein
MSPVRRRILVLAGCCLALAAIAWGANRGGHKTRVYSRLTAVPPAGFAPAADVTGLEPSAPVELAAGWLYLDDSGDVGLRDDWAHGGAANLGWHPVAIPNVFNPVVSNSTDGGSVGWYKLRFGAPPEAPGRSWAVRFDEIRRRADVWLNGVQIGSSTNTLAPFSLAASGLRPGGVNTLVVRVDSRRPPGSFPQDWWNWGGITQPVSLQPVGRVALRDVGVMPELGCDNRCGDVLVQGTLQNLAQVPLRPRFVVGLRSPGGDSVTSSRRGPLIRPGASMPVSFRVPVRGAPDLWAPGHPALYRVQIATGVQKRVEQRDTLRVGMRSIQVRKGVLYLNGRRLWLHGASIHEDMPGRGAALTDADIKTIVAELRSVGANITRAHYLLNQRLLQALDAAGILVWSQPPVDHADVLLRGSDGRARALGLLQSTILGGRSHPSVIIQSVGNELSPTPDAVPGTRAYIDQAIPLIRALDPAAAVAVDTYCYPGFPAQQVYTGVDVVGISHYFGWYKGLVGHPITDFAQLAPFLTDSHARYPNQALVISEFGAEGLYDGPAAAKGSYTFQTDYLKKTYGVLDRLPFMNGAIYWTLREFAVNPGWTGGAQLPAGSAPTGLHHKGLISYTGAEKPVFPVARQLFAQTPGYVH